MSYYEKVLIISKSNQIFMIKLLVYIYIYTYFNVIFNKNKLAKQGVINDPLGRPTVTPVVNIVFA